MGALGEGAAKLNRSATGLSLTNHAIRVTFVSPNWERLGNFLRKRRKELGYDYPEHLRQGRHHNLPPGKPSRGTLQNAEDGKPIDFQTFVYLAELYQVGFEQLLGALFSDYAKERRKAEDLVASIPWLAGLVEELADAGPEVREFVEGGLRQRDREQTG